MTILQDNAFKCIRSVIAMVLLLRMVTPGVKFRGVTLYNV